MLCVSLRGLVRMTIHDILVVLRMLCRNPNGMFWAGDTAQTISAGSSFSFNELKAFLFRIEVICPTICILAKK